MAFESKGPTTVNRITAPEPPTASVETRFAGTLTFKGGFPTEETLQHLYDQLDFQRGCQVFLRHIMAAAVWGFRQGFTRDVQVGSTDLGILHLTQIASCSPATPRPSTASASSTSSRMDRSSSRSRRWCSGSSTISGCGRSATSASRVPTRGRAADGTVEVYFGPEPPAGKASNWVRTLPDTGWFLLLRLYGPLEPWIDGSWKPGDLEAVNM